MKRPVAIAIAVGATLALGIGAWGYYCLYTTRSFNPFDGVVGGVSSLASRVASGPAVVNGRYSDELLTQWRNSPGEIAFTDSGARLPSDAHPATLVLPRSTAPFPRSANTGSRETRRAMFRYLRDALREASRGDEDVRVVMLRIAIESGWLRVAWHWNLGNVKAQRHVWSRNWSTAVAGQLQTDIGDADRIYILRDRLNSVDGYPGFATLGTYLAFDKRILVRRYADALVGAREGGYDGLVKAETAFGRGGYSSAPLLARLATARWYWDRCKALFGDVWDNRAAFDAYLDGANTGLYQR